MRMELCKAKCIMSNSVEVETVPEKPVDGEADVSIDFSLKHPLHNAWTLWFFENDRSLAWEQSQREIASVGTVEDFWSLYNHIKNASDLKVGCDYSLFKKGIKPMWEDEANRRGGRWLITLDRKQRGTGELDRFWLDVLLLMIGEAFDNSDEVCGAVVSVRNKGDKIGVWTRDSKNADAAMEIGRKIKSRLNISSKVNIGYELHVVASQKNSSTINYIYTI